MIYLLPEERRKSVIAGKLIAVLLIWILFFQFMWRNPHLLSEKRPHFELKSMKNFASRDLSSLVAFRGYLKYLDPKYGSRVYLALDLKEVITLQGESPNYPMLRLTFQHASAWLDFRPGKNETVELADIIIETDDNDVEKFCTISPRSIQYPVASHYTCEQAVSYDCLRQYRDDLKAKPVTKKIADFTLVATRIEANGNKQAHYGGKFAFPEHRC